MCHDQSYLPCITCYVHTKDSFVPDWLFLQFRPLIYTPGKPLTVEVGVAKLAGSVAKL